MNNAKDKKDQKMIGKLEVIKGEAKGLNCVIRDGDEASIGRNLECSIPVPDIKLSRVHCVVRNLKGEFQLLDNNSTNGTYVNTEKVEVAINLKEGDVIEIGDTHIRFSRE